MSNHTTKLTYKKEIFIFLSLVLIAFSIYFTSYLNLNFFWDDERFVFLNPEVLQAPHWYSFWQQGTPFTKTWPLGFSVFWMLIKTFPYSSIIFYKSLNIFFHAINAFLLYRIFKKMNFFQPFFLSLFFLVHPQHVEVVSWIFQFLTILSLTFFLLSFGAILAFLKSQKYIMLFCALLLFTFSLWTKSISLFVPFFYVFIFWIYKQPLKKYIVIIPFFIISLYVGLINLRGVESLLNRENAQIENVNFKQSQGVLERLPDLLPIVKNSTYKFEDRAYYDFIYSRNNPKQNIKKLNFNRLDIFKQGYLHYISNLFFPYNLQFLYPVKRPSATILALLFLVSVLLPFVACLKYSKKEFLFVPVFFVVFLSPYLGLNFVSFFYWSNVSDRYAYYFSILLPILLNFAFTSRSTSLFRRLLLCYLFLLVALNFKHGLKFNKPIIMYEEAIHHKPHPVIYNLLFDDYLSNLKVGKAEAILKEGVSKFPEDQLLKDDLFRLEVMKKNFRDKECCSLELWGSP